LGPSMFEAGSRLVVAGQNVVAHAKVPMARQASRPGSR
jgi:hypothetical protein